MFIIPESLGPVWDILRAPILIQNPTQPNAQTLDWSGNLVIIPGTSFQCTRYVRLYSGHAGIDRLDTELLALNHIHVFTGH